MKRRYCFHISVKHETSSASEATSRSSVLTLMQNHGWRRLSGLQHWTIGSYSYCQLSVINTKFLWRKTAIVTNPIHPLTCVRFAVISDNSMSFQKQNALSVKRRRNNAVNRSSAAWPYCLNRTCPAAHFRYRTRYCLKFARLKRNHSFELSL